MEKKSTKKISKKVPVKKPDALAVTPNKGVSTKKKK